MTEQSRADEVKEKLDRVRGMLAAEALEGALFTAQNNVSWITAGLDDVICRGQDPGFVWALVTERDAFVFTHNHEAPRIEAEEGVEALGFELVIGSWWTEGLEDLVEKRVRVLDRLVNDGEGPGISAPLLLQRLRLVLTAGEQARIRVLGADTCEAIEASLRGLSSGMKERELAAVISSELEHRAIVPGGFLIGGDRRRREFRHPTISEAPIERDVLAVIVGVRNGLNVALSRSASIGDPDDSLAERHIAACTVEACEIQATRPGATWEDALEAGIDAYARLGYAGEWEYHLQGGPIGYGTREFVPMPKSHSSEQGRWPIEAGQAYAWNPTVQGAKSEDTFLVTAEGHEPLTNLSAWPTITVSGPVGPLDRPAILRI